VLPVDDKVMRGYAEFRTVVVVATVACDRCEDLHLLRARWYVEGHFTFAANVVTLIEFSTTKEG